MRFTNLNAEFNRLEIVYWIKAAHHRHRNKSTLRRLEPIEFEVEMQQQPAYILHQNGKTRGGSNLSTRIRAVPFEQAIQRATSFSSVRVIGVEPMMPLANECVDA